MHYDVANCFGACHIPFVAHAAIFVIKYKLLGPVILPEEYCLDALVKFVPVLRCWHYYRYHWLKITHVFVFVLRHYYFIPLLVYFSLPVTHPTPFRGFTFLILRVTPSCSYILWHESYGHIFKMAHLYTIGNYGYRSQNYCLVGSQAIFPISLQ